MGQMDILCLQMWYIEKNGQTKCFTSTHEETIRQI